MFELRWLLSAAVLFVIVGAINWLGAPASKWTIVIVLVASFIIAYITRPTNEQ